MKAIEQHSDDLLFVILYKVVVAFESVDEVLKCHHSSESDYVSDSLVWSVGEGGGGGGGYLANEIPTLSRTPPSIIGPCFRQTIFDDNRLTLPCFGQIQTLFRTDSPKIIYPVQGSEAKNHTLSSSMPPYCIGQISECPPSPWTLVLFIMLYNLVLTFLSQCGEILNCDLSKESHPIEQYLKIHYYNLSCEDVYYVVQGGYNSDFLLN